jgi:tetratricopeptide (TPR) repeat protein
MKNETPCLSSGFRRLYCDPAVFDSFSTFHPISFRRVLPFQSQEPGVDDPHLIEAEEAHWAERNDATRRAVVDGYFQCGLLQQAEANNLRGVADFFDSDFFELMGLVYANAGKFKCALRWYRELIRELESQSPNVRSDQESVYASVGYCLYSLGLFEEAISWSKSCIGPRQMADTICEALIAYEAQSAGGWIQATERSGPRTRYTISVPAASDVSEVAEELRAAMKTFAPFHDVYMDWVVQESPSDVNRLSGYPFKAEFDGSSLLRHRMNLIFAACGQADALVEKGYGSEAKRVLSDAAMLEPNASFVWERLRALDHQP